MDNSIVYGGELYHYGRKGMKWYQNIFSKDRGKKGSKTSKDDDDNVETKKQKILKSRSAKKLYENADLFSTAELQSAYNRLTLERNILSLAPKEVSKGRKFIDKYATVTKDVHTLYEGGSKLYNDAAKVYNTFFKEEGGQPWPLIRDNDKQDKKKD